MALRLNKNDLQNLFNLLKRGKFDGLEEAEVAVHLSFKLKAMAQELENGSDLPSVDQPSAESSLGG
jgi:hypothetical protein